VVSVSLCVYKSRVGSPNYLRRLVVLCPDSEKSLKIHPSAWKVNPANYFAWEAFCDSLRVLSDSAAIVRLFGARRLSQHNLLSFLSRAPKRCLPRIYEGIPQVDRFLALSCSRRTCGDEFPMNSAKEILGLFPMNVRSHPHPLLSLRAELSVTPPLLFGSLAAS
jgi:hypothetical protein